MRIYISEQEQGSETPSQFAGKPVYFFDISVLRSSVASLIGWSHEKLEAAIAPRVENAISDADLWLTTPLGFFVIFANPDPILARTQANAICVDILKHFYGQEKYPPEYVEQFCRPSSARDLEQAGLQKAPRLPQSGVVPTKTTPPKQSKNNSYSDRNASIFSGIICARAMKDYFGSRHAGTASATASPRLPAANLKH